MEMCEIIQKHETHVNIDYKQQSWLNCHTKLILVPASNESHVAANTVCCATKTDLTSFK